MADLRFGLRLHPSAEGSLGGHGMYFAKYPKICLFADAKKELDSPHRITPGSSLLRTQLTHEITNRLCLQNNSRYIHTSLLAQQTSSQLPTLSGNLGLSNTQN